MLTDAIRYGVGNEHNPTDPFGRVELTIAPDGRAALEHVSRRGRRTWSATVRPAALARLVAVIASSGFPDVPLDGPVRPDTTLRRLSVGSVSALVVLRPEVSPAYAEAFALLDAIAEEISDGTISNRAPSGPSLVTAVEPG